MELHPAVVHFPIALIVSAALIDLLALLLRRPHWHHVSLWNLALGVVGAVVAARSGTAAAEVFEHTAGTVHAVLERHAQLGTITMWVGLGLLAWRIVRRDRMSQLLRALTVAITVGLASTVSAGGYLGGRLVHEFGAGHQPQVAPQAKPEPHQGHQHHHGGGHLH